MGINTHALKRHLSTLMTVNLLELEMFTVSLKYIFYFAKQADEEVADGENVHSA